MEVRYGIVVWLRTRQHGEYEVIATSIPAEERRGEEREGEEKRGEGRRGEEMEVSNTHRQFIDSVYQSQ